MKTNVEIMSRKAMNILIESGFPKNTAVRVVWDEKKIHSIIYIDPCINRENVLSQIIDAFDIGDYVVEYDDHYHCKNCVGDLFN